MPRRIKTAGVRLLPQDKRLIQALESVRELVRIASAEPGLTQVLAHTLPGKNASGSVLTNAGFTRVGEVIDPEDGPVWRWVHPA